MDNINKEFQQKASLPEMLRERAPEVSLLIKSECQLNSYVAATGTRTERGSGESTRLSVQDPSSSECYRANRCTF